MKQRLHLENLIFKRAFELGAGVYSKDGCLLSLSQDGYLQALLNVYNQFFSTQNKADYPQMPDYIWEDFLYQSACFASGLLPFQDVKTEVFCENFFNKKSVYTIKILEKNKMIDKKNKI